MDNQLYETERLIFRLFTHQDIEFLRDLNSDKDVMRHLEHSNSDVTDIGRLIDSYHEHFIQHGFSSMVVVDKPSHNYIATVRFKYFDEVEHLAGMVEIGWRVVKNCWNNGYATEISRKIFDVAFNQLNLNEVIAIVSEHNKASIRVLEKSGMVTDLADNFIHPKRKAELNPYRLYKITDKMYQYLK